MSSFPQRVMLVANTGWYLYNFRQSLAVGLKQCGIEPIFVSPRDAFSEKLVQKGFSWRELPLKRASLNPFAALFSVLRLTRLYRQDRPDLVHHFTPKCVFFGTLAAKLSGVPAVVNSVTGLGHLAEDKRLHYRAIFAAEKVLYRLALKGRNVRVVLQNPDDYGELIRLGLIDPAKCRQIRGSGVDTARYSPKTSNDKGDPLTVLFASRLLEAKGIYELVEAARVVKQKHPTARIWIAGEPDEGNPTSVSKEDLDSWRKEGVVELLGHQDPIDEWIARSSVVVLPSYREGLPKILLEASSMEKPVVATDVAGCREVVMHGETGLLVKVRSAESLAEALNLLLGDEPLRKKMGRAGRKKVVEDFSAERVIRETVDVYRGFFGRPAER